MSDIHNHNMTNKNKETVLEAKNDEQKSEVALREEAMLTFWKEHDIFNKSVEKEAPNGGFVFYDGPPFATGLPHYGHILASTIKDAIPRFWTMNGYRVERKWGWDCHGLPLENLIEKRLGLATKRDIEEYGVKNFNEAARSTVMEYADDWKQIIPRMGRWADMNSDYKTMDSTYTESVWWVFKSLHDKGLVYEGFKSMHLCPRCGTTLSNFEVNQGYQDIKDIAVTVKLPLLDEQGEKTDTSLLVWTTTPWTLPGNMAAAVHNDHDYVKVTVGVEDMSGTYILAKDRLSQLGTDEYEVVEEIKGSLLVGLRYEPPFSYFQDRDFENKKNAWKVYHADYVELGEEGTGAVHLAPAYGDEDMELAKEQGIPLVHHVDESGRFRDFVTDFAGQLVKPKDDDEAGILHLDTDIEIVKALKESGKLLRKENITHSYPHCWRCDTPLLNYATTSWFVRVTDIKDELVAENNKIHWVPEHVGKNRFGKWLEGARDWAVSRQRYWGAPLPIWRNPETKEHKVFGSLDELKQYIPNSDNRYLVMRHGESEKNVAQIVTDDYDAPYPLTEQGRETVRKSARNLKGKIDLIITSPVLRAKETAGLVAEEVGLSSDQVVVDERIRETNHGEYEGKPLVEYQKAYPSGLSKFVDRPEGGESWSDIRKRMGEFLYSLEKDYQNKNVLIISHGDPLSLLNFVAMGSSNEYIVREWNALYPEEKGVAKELQFTPLPHNDDYVLDFHRPYIDEVELYEDEVRLERVLDVFDCWFESGSMPYGQHHYPFENEKEFEKNLFPANFIAEGLDQTRGWFYSLIVLSTALFGKSSYQNVIVNGLIMAEDGKKLSKKLQNYSEPTKFANEVGADSIRHYLLSSSIVRGEDLNFSDQAVRELQRKNIGRLHNVLQMYQMYVGSIEPHNASDKILDRWILSRLGELIAESTTGYKNYELDKATRPITDFIDDLSVWYLRRSRDRLKGTDTDDKELAVATLGYVLKNLALVMAPVMPFYSEYLWQEIRRDEDVQSVHLASWPEGEKTDEELIENMKVLRELVTSALEVRAKANIKVRQPLATLFLKEDAIVSQEAELAALVLEEVNVKKLQQNASMVEDVSLDINITPELKTEGDVRELIRAVQDMRKESGLKADDNIKLVIATDEVGQKTVDAHMDMLAHVVGAETVSYGEVSDGREVTIGDTIYKISF
ncbi:isoleucine--tRNA ligase [bacterium]|nr:isoleucine--tRNA ligase [bacterium]